MAPGPSSATHIADLLDTGLTLRHAHGCADDGRWVLQCEGRRSTAASLRRRVRALAAALTDDDDDRRGGAVVEAGQRVLLLAHNTDHFLEALLSASAAGAVVAPLNHRWSVAEAVASAAPLSPVALLVDAACADLGAALVSSIPSIRTYIHIGGVSSCVPPPGCRFAEALIAANGSTTRERAMACRRSPDGIAMLCFTSGTSGRSKAVMLSHDALVGQALAKVELASYSPHDTYLHAAPLFHVGGLSYALAALAAGARHILLPRFTADAARAALQTHSVTATIMVPAILNQLTASNATATFPALRSVVVGAGRPSRAQLRACRAMFPSATFHTAYGMTEVASTITWRTLWRPGEDVGELEPLAEGAHPSALGCVGRCIANTELRVMATRKREAGVGEEGEVWVRGAHVMLGYFEMADETAAASSADGWLITGDIGCFDRSGRLWLMGRKKDIIKSGGENVHAGEVEAVIVSHKGVTAAAVVGIPDEALGERVGVLVQMAEGWAWEGCVGEQQRHGTVALRDLQQHCIRSGLSRYKMPRVGWGSQDELPVNAAGKVLKEHVKSRLLAHMTCSKL